MKLAILSDSFLLDQDAPINGTAVQLYNLSKGFVDQGLEVHYLCYSFGERQCTETIEIEGIILHFVRKYSTNLWLIHRIKFFWRELRKIGPDAIYVRGRSFNLFIALLYARRYAVPLVWGTNGEDSLQYWKNARRIVKKPKSTFIKLVLLCLKVYEDIGINFAMKYPTYIINQTESQRLQTKRNLHRDSIVLTSYYPYVEVDRMVKQNQVLWLGNISEAKQPHIFIEMCDRHENSRWNFILVGENKDRVYGNELEKRLLYSKVKSLGKVSFFESFNYYRESKIYLNTSAKNADGLPNSFIQSWLCGTVVLSLNHDPNNWMTQFGIGYCANGDVEKLYEKMNYLIKNKSELETMSNKAMEFAKTTFNNQKIIAGYLDLFINAGK